MEIQENLAMALRRGKSRGLGWGIKKRMKRTSTVRHWHSSTWGYSDPYDQQSGLTLRRTAPGAHPFRWQPSRSQKLLLLDEHTAALDPKTARKVLDPPKKIVDEQNLAALMVTHNA